MFSLKKKSDQTLNVKSDFCREVKLDAVQDSARCPESFVYVVKQFQQ